MVAEPRLRVYGRSPQDGTIPSSIVFASDGVPVTATGAAAPTVSGGIIVASEPITTLTQTVAAVSDGRTVTVARTLAITDEAQLSSALREGITLTTPTASSTSANTNAASSTNTSAPQSEGPKMGVLIPAIVAPVVVFLLIAFGLFWWVIRRRAKRAAEKEPEFVMEKRQRTRRHSRDDSTHSNSSTRKLVPKTSFGTGLNKEAVPAVREISRPSMDVFSDNHETSNGLGIGVAKSPEHTPAHSRQNSDESQNPSGTPARAPVAVRNFSRGPTRPSTANQESNPPSQQFNRDRSMSNPGSRPMPPPGARPDPRDQQYGRGQPSMMDRPDPRRPPPPAGRVPPPMGSLRGPPRGPPMGSPPNDRSNPSGRPGPGPGLGARSLQDPMGPSDRSRHEPARNRPIIPPPAIETQEIQASQKAAALSPPTPTGAYNGASPISQYSPIIKEHPRLDGSPPGDQPNTDRTGQNGSSPDTPQTSSSFTEENMRIARLADSSRLGFYKDTNPKVLPSIATSQAQEPIIEPPNPSPRLPPPATRDAPPLNFPPPPPPPVDSPTIHSSRRADSFANDRRSMRSMVSRLSDDEYVDMEVDDAKSDVSSLDEREKWDMENEARNAAGSRTANNGSSLGGYGGLGAPGSNLRSAPRANGVDDGTRYNPSRF